MRSRRPVYICFLIIFLFIHSIYFSTNVVAGQLCNPLEPTCDQFLIAESEAEEDQLPAEQSLEQSLKADPSLFSILLRMFFALAIVLGLIYLMLKLLNRRQNLFQQVQTLENLGGISVGQNKTIQIVRVGSAFYMIGVGDNVELLKEIKDEQTIKDLMERQTDDGQTLQSWLQNIFSKKERQDMTGETNYFNDSFQAELEKMRKHRHEIIDHIEQKEDRHE